MATVIDFLVRLRVGRRQYWMAMPLVFATGAGGWTLTAWSAHASGVLWVIGLTVLSAAAVLGLWVLFRRMNDNASLILWFAGISVGGRLAKAAAHMAGGSRSEADMALGLFFLVVLVALGLAPSKRTPALDGNSDEDDEAEARAPL